MCSINERHPDRIGKITSSRIKEILGAFKEPTKYAESNKDKAGQIKYPGGWSVGARTYARELAMARLGYVAEDVSTWAMMWGNQWEPVSRESYAKKFNRTVTDEQFVSYNEFIGSTPDGFIDDDGIFETKCLQMAGHLKAFEQPDPDHVIQVQHQLFVTGRKWADLVYFHPDAPTKKSMRKVWRIIPDWFVHAQFLDDSVIFEELVKEYVKLYKD
jgi:hypothetical protein